MCRCSLGWARLILTCATPRAREPASSVTAESRHAAYPDGTIKYLDGHYLSAYQYQYQYEVPYLGTITPTPLERHGRVGGQFSVPLILSRSLMSCVTGSSSPVTVQAPPRVPSQP